MSITAIENIVHWAPNFDPISGDYTYDLWTQDGMMVGFGFRSYSEMMEYVDRARLILENIV